LDGSRCGIIRLRTATMRLDWAKTPSWLARTGCSFPQPRRLRLATLLSRRWPTQEICGNWTPQFAWSIALNRVRGLELSLAGWHPRHLNGDFNGPRISAIPRLGTLPPTRICFPRRLVVHPVGQKLNSRRRRLLRPPELQLRPEREMRGPDWPTGPFPWPQIPITGKFYRGAGTRAWAPRSEPASLPPEIYRIPARPIPLNTIGGWSQLSSPNFQDRVNNAFGQDSASREMSAPETDAYLIPCSEPRHPGECHARPRSTCFFRRNTDIWRRMLS